MKYIYYSILFLLVSSCEDSTNVIDTNKPDVQIIETLEEKIKHHVEATLQIPATEKYTLEMYSEHLNSDDSTDMIITVNRVEYAIDKALQHDKLAKKAEMGFMGTYNYFFFMDGATKDISVQIPVPSSAKGKLKVSFENIRTEAYKDIMVDFKLTNGSFRRFFTMYNKLPRQTFEIMLYDGLGDIENKAIVIKYDQGSYSLAKDILIYTGELEKVKFDDPSKVYDYNPTIEETGVLERRWFYNDNQRKYFTRKDS